MRHWQFHNAVHNERLETMVERCLESQAAYKLFDRLAAIAQLDLETKEEYIDTAKESGAYTKEEIGAIERLIISGAAQYFKDEIDQVRDERIVAEIEEMVK